MSVQQDEARAPGGARAEVTEALGARGDLVPLCSCSAMSLPSPTGEVIVLRVAGEVDLCSLPVLRAALTEVLSRRAEHVIVDLAELRFCSVRGLAVLVDAGDTANGQATNYALCGASRQANRVWALGWPDAELPIQFPSAGAAVLAALAPQAGRHDRAPYAPKQAASWPADGESGPCGHPRPLRSPPQGLLTPHGVAG